MAQRNITSTRFKTTTVKGLKVFYREAGDPANPTILLLHGLPSSSAMFRDLISALSDRFHLIAPDLIGYGHSDAPSRDDFKYTFENLTIYVRGLLEQLQITSYILYGHDIGGPVGFRLFNETPEKIKGLIIQNTNAYVEGVDAGAKKILGPLWENRNAETEEPAKKFLTADYIQYLWTVGAKDPDNVNPDNWLLDQVRVDRPGSIEAQVDILEDLKTNAPLYPTWQEAFREHQPKTLVFWGNKDPVFIPPGAEGYLRDLTDVKLVWLDAGHFVLDENLETVASEIREKFAK